MEQVNMTPGANTSNRSPMVMIVVIVLIILAILLAVWLRNVGTNVLSGVNQEQVGSDLTDAQKAELLKNLAAKPSDAKLLTEAQKAELLKNLNQNKAGNPDLTEAQTVELLKNLQ